MILLRIIKQYKGIEFPAAFKYIDTGQILGFKQSMQFFSQIVDIFDLIREFTVFQGYSPPSTQKTSACLPKIQV
jgi:hypothetical protein